MPFERAEPTALKAIGGSGSIHANLRSIIGFKSFNGIFAISKERIVRPARKVLGIIRVKPKKAVETHQIPVRFDAMTMRIRKTEEGHASFVPNVISEHGLQSLTPGSWIFDELHRLTIGIKTPRPGGESIIYRPTNPIVHTALGVNVETAKLMAARVPDGEERDLLVLHPQWKPSGTGEYVPLEMAPQELEKHEAQLRKLVKAGVSSDLRALIDSGKAEISFYRQPHREGKGNYPNKMVIAVHTKPSI
ncbi:TPA: hypothetical protein HA244_02840 [Candidatus Micrarchaeota archaeon]|nr:hypothetical protein [Candidatus Micrarchaeota archaeon]